MAKHEPKQILVLAPDGMPALFDLVDGKPLPQSVIDFWAETGVDLTLKPEDTDR